MCKVSELSDIYPFTFSSNFISVEALALYEIYFPGEP